MCWFFLFFFLREIIYWVPSFFVNDHSFLLLFWSQIKFFCPSVWNRNYSCTDPSVISLANQSKKIKDRYFFICSIKNKSALFYIHTLMKTPMIRGFMQIDLQKLFGIWKFQSTNTILFCFFSKSSVFKKKTVTKATILLFVWHQNAGTCSK